jgi:anti-sigma regulatory factor (Ser/Thr protein kinase)
MKDSSWPDTFREDLLLVSSELLTNAVEASRDGVDINVDIALDVTSLCLVVSNYGSGLEVESLPPPTTTQRRGRGIALSKSLGRLAVEQLGQLTIVRVEMKLPETGP